MNDIVENARHRLRVLAMDTAHEITRVHRRITCQEHADITILLDELHRLHLAVSSQAQVIRKLLDQKNNQAARPKKGRAK